MSIENKYSPEQGKNYQRDPEAVKDLNNAYDSTLYGHLEPKDDVLGENPSLTNNETALDPHDQSDELFYKAVELANERDGSLRQNPDRNDGVLSVKMELDGQDVLVNRTEDWLRDEHPGAPITVINFPPQIIEENGARYTQTKKFVETSPGRWECQVENSFQSGDESMLNPESLSDNRELTGKEVMDMNNMFNQANIDPESQKNLDNTPDANVTNLTAEAIKFAEATPAAPDNKTAA